MNLRRWDPLERFFIRNELTLKRWRRFKRNKIAMFCLWVMVAFFFFSFTAEFWANSKPHFMKYQGHYYAPLFFDYHPSRFGLNDIFVMDYRSLEMKDGDWWIWPLVQWNPYENNSVVENYPSPPTRDNFFGTDDRGRDVFTRLLYGLRYTLIFAMGSWFLTYCVGCAIGAFMGYFGGKTDLLGMRAVEIIESMPVFFILITMISIFNPNIGLLICFMVLFGWTNISQYMRAQFLSLRKREYIEAARAIGANNARIVFKHILPNALTPIVTFAPFTIAAYVSTLSFMDYLGLGLRPPTPSWGELLSQAQRYFTIAEWLVWAPAGALVITLTLLINIGLAVRDAFDPRSSVG
ncbi:MAG: ABC transporter permease subunit [Bdellovibrionaceae bacterium]|nr:ABC transporter permease subunit [Pseudobdellovibrionaceae bacterium]MBX3032664.1 ABC transporter permease subunit [Pseudobdellovibrionaceae bacterium]